MIYKSALDDAGIPVLTEVIAAPQETAHLHHDIAPPAAAATETQRLPAIDGWREDEWNRMERKISGHILHQVMARLDTAIEQQVRDSLADALQTAVEGLATEIKHNLQHSLEQVISQAVSEEVARMQSFEK